MFSKELHRKIRISVQWLQKHVERLWYPPFVGLLAALDNVVIIIPNDGILISSSMLTPRRWVFLALSVAIGSTIGALALALLVEYHGLPWVLQFYPGMEETRVWSLTMEFFEKYGMLVVFGVAVTPFMQQPAVILAGLASTPLFELAVVIFTGRFIKFLTMAYLGSHAPRLLKKMWGLKDELKDSGVSIKE